MNQMDTSGGHDSSMPPPSMPIEAMLLLADKLRKDDYADSWTRREIDKLANIILTMQVDANDKRRL